MLTCSFSVSHLIKHDKTPLWTQRCLTIEPPVWKIVNITSWWHPVCAKSQDHNQSGPVPDPDPTAVCPSCLPSHSMPCCVTSTQRRGLFGIPGGALNEKSQGLWCIWYTGSFVSWKTKTDFKVLLLKEDKCQTESDCLCDDNWSTLHSWTINILQTPKLHHCILNHNLPWRVLSLNCLNFRFP